VVVVLLVWAFWIGPRHLVFREVALDLPHWTGAPPTLRVAVLTDLHIGSPHNGLEKLRRIVAGVNQRKPDVVLILGDLVIQGVVGGKFVAPEAIAAELSKLRSVHGTYAVLGNHDWWLDAARVCSALKSNGAVVVEDSAVALRAGGGTVWLAGVSDFWEGKHDMNRALREVAPNQAVIIFTHNPDIFPEVPDYVALTIAGHTHGGQVRLPIVGAPLVPSRYGQRYARGHIVERGRDLFVSVGTGMSILPVRFRVPPEVVMLTLRGRQGR
jgi:uncharacterized protein